MILHRYFSRRFLMSFASMFGVFLLLQGFIDLVEQGRRFSGADAGPSQIIALTLLNLPQALYELLPLVTVLSAIALFLALSRSSELVVARAAGRSALRAFLGPLLMTLLIGLVAVALFNPIVAATLKEYETRSSNLRENRSSILSISDDGLWLRQGDAARQTVIRAEATNLDGTVLRQVTFITFAAEQGPVRRIEAARAELAEGAWVLTDAKSWPLSDARVSEQWATTHDSLRIPSSLSADQIRDSFGTPSSIPVWDLPAFIDRLESAGFSALRHRVWFQMELAQPLFLCAMVLIAAGFTMRPQRGRRVGLLVLTAVVLSFGLYFLRNFAQILGDNGQIPVALAAWAPPVAGIAAALGLLLHLEDG
ncbi:LPS export ABC transporter permease LptG [Roseovarius sp. SYSU LYC5161]|jgi:lipopolysaccharide export system permease protein|uniref:LPS export ABC transporter permease LptG n=1 Tax=Roseovarius halophilus (ex Wu et al. 2025) TaxID=3376060 RepID=UPI00399A9D50